MSGICGICEPGRAIRAENLASMLAAQTLPGETETVAEGGMSAALGVARRWEFQQVAAFPGVRIAVDADLYNLAELAATVAAQGSPNLQGSVGEVLAALYARKGIEFLELLHGAFSLAVWDEQAQRLILAIDRLGVKSLYWRREADRLLFASKVGSIRAAQEQPAEVDQASVMQYLLFSAVPAPLTIYRGTEKLSPGSCLIFEKGAVRQKKYWDLEYPESEKGDVRYWAAELRREIRLAVHRHLDGCDHERTGAYLSGGTDSSSVVAFMNERHSPVHTFSISFQEGGYSEVGFARTTAEHFQTDHHEKCIVPTDTYAAISKITEYYDEPFANSSAVGAYYCALMARQAGMDTLLAGDGGDELFAGNERYLRDKYLGLYSSLPTWSRSGLVDPLINLLPENGSWLSLPRRYVRRAKVPNPRRFFSYNFFLNLNPEEAFLPEFLAQAPPERWLEIAERHFRAAKAESSLNRQLYLDVKVTLADNDLRKVAGTAELAGIRVRFPLLDDRLAEFSGRIPTSLKLKGFQKRYIFKQAMKGILPDKVLYKKKHGFGVPLALWLSQDQRLRVWMQDLLGDTRTRQRGYFRPAFFHQLLDKHHGEQPGFYGEIVWYLLVLELWHRHHFEKKESCVPSA